MTPILAAGPSTSAGDPRPRGFTLLEVLVVLVLIGVVAALALPSLGRQSGRATQAAAEELADTWNYAGDAAVLSGHVHGVLMAGTGYRVVRFEGASWQPDRTSSGRLRRLPAGAFIDTAGLASALEPIPAGLRPQAVFLPDASAQARATRVRRDGEARAFELRRTLEGRFVAEPMP